jgi:hypothetical protein
MHPFSHFRQALVALGQTDRDRCQMLGLNPRTLTRYKAGQLPPPFLAFLQCPELFLALADDARAFLATQEASQEHDDAAARAATALINGSTGHGVPAHDQCTPGMPQREEGERGPSDMRTSTRQRAMTPTQKRT